MSKRWTKIFAKKSKISPINRLPRGVGFGFKKILKSSQILPISLSKNLQSQVGDWVKKKIEKLRGFDVRSLRFPLARFKQNFGSFCAQFWGQQPAAKGGLSEWENLDLRVLSLGASSHQESANFGANWCNKTGLGWCPRRKIFVTKP